MLIRVLEDLVVSVLVALRWSAYIGCKTKVVILASWNLDTLLLVSHFP